MPQFLTASLHEVTGAAAPDAPDNHGMVHRWKPNTTVAAIIEREGRFLLVEEHTTAGLRLNQPAGHLDAGESLEAACIREVLEETAHAFRPAALVGIYQWQPPGEPADGTSYLRFAYCGTADAVQPAPALDAAIVRTLWMTAAEIRACPDWHRSPLVLRGLDDYLAGARYPVGLVQHFAGSDIAI